MPERLSRHERMQLQSQAATSIFDLAKTAQARAKGGEDIFFISQKEAQLFERGRITSYVPSSPSNSDVSENEECLSDVSDELKEEEEDRERQAHRAAALDALEGRAPLIEFPQPIFRSARMDYDDNVEAEHGQLYTFQPRPRRPAARFQRSVSNWETQLAATEALVEEENFELCNATTAQYARAGPKEVMEWLNSESPVYEKQHFYSQPSGQSDEFWGEMTMEELNAIA